MNHIIVTGASGNLGQAVIKKFLRENYHVTGTLIPNDPLAVDSQGKHFETAVVDLMQEEATAHFIDRMLEKYQKIDVVVLTVGGFAMGNMLNTGSADIFKQYKLNFETAYHVARPVFAQMMKQGSGRIFLIGSRPGADMKNSKGMVAYSLTKSLIFRLAELMNEEARGTEIITSVIVPSTIDTPQNRASMPDADFSKWQTPEAIAEVIYWHCTEEGAMLREEVIKVYGGV